MFNKIYWNKWGFIPAVVFVIASCLLLQIMDKTPRWPLHFNLDGIPNRFGSSNELWILVFFQIIFIVAMVGLDEEMVRLRTRRFNTAGIMVSGFGGIMFNVLLQTFYAGQQSSQRLSPHFLAWLIASFLIPGIAAYILECFRHYPENETIKPRQFTMPDLTQSNWIYWEHYNPWWNNALLIGILIMVTAPRLMILRINFQLDIFLLPLFILISIFIGGFQLIVNSQQLSVTFGWLRIPCLKIKTTNIATVEVVEFNALTRFGGWGIKYTTWGGWGFILGNNGVLLHTKKGRKFTISTKEPELVAKIIKKVTTRPI